MPRVNIAADADLMKELEKEAKSRGYTIYSLTNISLRAMLELIKNGEDSTTLTSLVEFYKISKDLEIIPVTSWYIESLVKLAYEKDQKALEEICEGAGQQISSYLKSRASSLEELLEIYNNIRSALPIKDINVRQSSNSVLEIRVTGSGFSKEATFCTSRVFKKILETYNFEVLDLSYSPGGIILAKIKVNKGK